MLSRIVRKVKRILNPIKDISDPYTNALMDALGGYPEKGNLAAFDHAIQNIPDNTAILEIGSFCGLSTILLDYYKQKYRKTNAVFNCDKWIWNDEGFIGASNITYVEYLKFVKESFVKNVQTFSTELPFTIELFSDELFELWEKEENVKDLFGRDVQLGGQLGFSFIDGNHDYEFAKRDFDNSDKFLVQNGFILVDDSADGGHFTGVHDVCAEVEKSGRFEVVMKNPNYLFRKK